MVVHVEFYGIPRSRAGVAHTEFEVSEPTTTLGNVVQELQQRFPDFASDCIADGKLTASVVANIQGERFVRDSSTTIHDGQTLLIMSADVGG